VSCWRGSWTRFALRRRRRGVRNPPLGPLSDFIQRALQGAPFLRQRVFHADRCVGHDDPLDDPFRLELAQALRQHAVADVGDGIAELGIPHASVEQQADDGAGPAAADQLDRMVKAAAQRVLKSHGASIAKAHT